MMIQLPNDLESRVEATVRGSRLASVDDAMAEAARLLLRELDRGPSGAKPTDAPGLGLIGALRDDADWLDLAVEHAMRVREGRPWRLNPAESGPL